jgi:ParB-like chromosome segregation protein Spo0J
VDTRSVRLDDLRPYPGNPRIGNVELIAESLRSNGQYRPIVVRTETSEILAGNHTWQAAKRLGWESIEATFVDVDDATARRIVLVDNRSNDIASYDAAILTDLLATVAEEGESLLGTGYCDDDLERLLAVAQGTQVEPPDEFPSLDEDLATEHRCPKCGYEWSGAKA